MARPAVPQPSRTDGASAPVAVPAAVSRSDLIFLRLAAHKGQLARLQQLLDKGVPVDTVLDHGTTALLLAAQSGHTDVVAALLAHGASVFAQRASDGMTPLVAAISGEHAAIVELLLCHRAGLRAAAHNTQVAAVDVALQVAATRGTTSVVAHVLDREATTDDADAGATPLQIELSQGHVPVLRALLRSDEVVRWADGSLDVLLLVACQASDAAMVTALLARGVDPHARAADGLTPLVHAVVQSNAAVVGALLSATNKAQAQAPSVAVELFFATTESGETNVVAAVLEPSGGSSAKDASPQPLLLQLSETQLDVVRALLERGDRVAWVGLSLEVALFAAAQVGRLDLVLLLLARHARADFVSDAGVTPLVAASMNGHTGVVRALLNDGATRSGGGGSGWDDAALALPLSVAVAHGHAAVVSLLIEHGADANTPSDDTGDNDTIGDGGALPVTVAAVNGHVDVVKVLLREDVAVEWTDDEAARVIVFAAVESGLEHIVAEYLDQGGDPDARNRDSVSLLHIACATGHAAVVTVLLARGAAVDLLDVAGGVTPLMIAAQDGDVEIVATLLDHGASPNVVEPSQGVTPLLIAAQNGHADIVELLLGHGADALAQRGDGSGPLVLAASHGHTDVVDALLRVRAETAASEMQEDKNDKRAEARASGGAGVTASGDSLESALAFAAQAGHTAIAKALLASGTDATATTPDGAMPLAAAAQSGHVAMLHLLLEHNNGDVSTDAKGLALLVAAQCGHLDAVVALLECGARADFATADGVTAEELAVAGAFPAIARALREWKQQQQT